MSSAARDHLLARLAEAEAMETRAIGLLEAQLPRFAAHLELRERVEAHLAETRDQHAALRACRAGLDAPPGPPAAGPDTTAILVDLQAQLRQAFGHEAVCEALAAYAFEAFEIATYQRLIVAAWACGEPAVARLGGDSLRQEEAMARWLWAQLPHLTVRYLTFDRLGRDVRA